MYYVHFVTKDGRGWPDLWFGTWTIFSHKGGLYVAFWIIKLTLIIIIEKRTKIIIRINETLRHNFLYKAAHKFSITSVILCLFYKPYNARMHFFCIYESNNMLSYYQNYNSHIKCLVEFTCLKFSMFSMIFVFHSFFELWKSNLKGV